MPKPIMHTRIRESFEIAQAPEQVAEALQNLATDNLTVQIDDTSGDDIPFSITRTNNGRDEISITGLIQRWQGTETRLDYEGVVDVPAPNERLQHLLVVLVVIVINLLLLRFLMGDIEVFMALFDARAMLGVFGLWILVTIVVGWIAYGLIVRDTAGGHRWQVQQEMGEIIQDMKALRLMNNHQSKQGAMLGDDLEKTTETYSSS